MRGCRVAGRRRRRRPRAGRLRGDDFIGNAIVEVAFGDRQLADALGNRHEKNLELVTLYPLASYGGAKGLFAPAGQAEAEQVVATPRQFAVEQRGQLPPRLLGWTLLVEGAEGLSPGRPDSLIWRSMRRRGRSLA